MSDNEQLVTFGILFLVAGVPLSILVAVTLWRFTLERIRDVSRAVRDKDTH